MFNASSFVERDIVHLEHVVPYVLTVRGVSLDYWRARLNDLLEKPLDEPHRVRAQQLLELLAGLESLPKCRSRVRQRA